MPTTAPRDLTDVFAENTRTQTEEHFGFYTTIRHVTLTNGSEWTLASGAHCATAVPVIDGITRDDQRITGRSFHDLHGQIVIAEGLLPS